MALQELDFSQTGNQRFRDWLSRLSIVVVIFVWSDWRRKEKCQLMRQAIEGLSGNPNYLNCVMFLSFSADKNGGPCLELSVMNTPCLLIFKNGKEVARFHDVTSKEAIGYQLEVMLDRARNHMRGRIASAAVVDSSPFSV